MAAKFTARLIFNNTGHRTKFATLAVQGLAPDRPAGTGFPIHGSGIYNNMLTKVSVNINLGLHNL
jgi:hypothetical protein